MMRLVAMAGMLGGWMVCCSIAAAAQTVYPCKDGTLVDGGIYGAFDGVADDADWYFNNTSYEGSITLSTKVGSPNFEHRVVWEYNLSSVSLEPPVSAMLTFTIRGAPIWPFPDVDVHVYSYPADLLETLGDFSSVPAVFQGSVTISPYQLPTEYSLDVSSVVSESLHDGDDKVAFRFQIDPDTPYSSNQAFIDAVDSDPSTKAFLTIDEASAPGDFDGDGDVDLDDYAVFVDCMPGPDTPPTPTIPEVTGQMCLDAFDFDKDEDVDLNDFGAFQGHFSGTRSP
ncbi:MAG: hypothetical protein KAV82_07935 [Phycisphaerae bacterium]|nr:hypothetical protein [Phycisphaerae bacterium]